MPPPPTSDFGDPDETPPCIPAFPDRFPQSHQDSDSLCPRIALRLSSEWQGEEFAHRSTDQRSPVHKIQLLVAPCALHAAVATQVRKAASNLTFRRSLRTRAIAREFFDSRPGVVTGWNGRAEKPATGCRRMDYGRTGTVGPGQQGSRRAASITPCAWVGDRALSG